MIVQRFEEIKHVVFYESSIMEHVPQSLEL